jgi:hypothetical protein
MRNNLKDPTKSNKTERTPPITLNKVYSIILIILGILGVWKFFFPNIFESKAKDIIKNEIRIDSSSFNQVQNRDSSSIGRDQINAAHDNNITNTESFKHKK